LHSNLDLSELESKIGSLFMAGMPGTILDHDTDNLIRTRYLGGLILFKRNIENPVQLASLCNDIQKRALKYHGIPLFLAIDQEGGPVARLPGPFTRFPGNSAIGEDEQPVNKAEEFARITAREMSLVGLNMNLAPVLDVPRGKPEKHLAGRTFGNDPVKVALLGRTVIKTLQKNGVMSVAKHFPGLGLTPEDPHHQLPTIDFTLDEMESTDLPPFISAISESVSGVMTSHAVYPALDPVRPATISKTIITGLLRQKLNFQGLIITDDMEMGAVEKKWGTVSGSLSAFEAGADILLICKDQAKVIKAMDMLKQKFLRNEISMQRLLASLERIGKAKAKFLGRPSPVSPEDVQAYFNL